MRPGKIVVIGVTAHNPSKMRFTENNYMIKAFTQANRIAEQFTKGTPAEQRRLAQSLIQKTCIAPGKLEISVNASNLTKALLGEKSVALNPTQTEISIDAPFHIKRRGVEAKLILSDEAKSKPDTCLIRIIAKAHYWVHQLTSGKARSIEELAKVENKDRNEISRSLPLAFLAPDIVQAILSGTQPDDLSATRLNRLADIPLEWKQQRTILGFKPRA